MKRKFAGVGGAILASAVLAGCGGGGGGSSSTSGVTTSSVAAQGVYQGTTSTGQAFELLVLDDGTYYDLNGTNSGNQFMVTDLIQGTSSINGTSFSSSDMRDFLFNGQTVNGSVSATIVAASSVNGTVTEGTNNVTFSGAPPATTTYNYNTAADINTITGSWSLTTLQGASSSLAINANGTFSGSSNGCTYTGMVTPRSSGKNVFNVSVQFGPSPCVLANGSATGIALSYPISGTSLTQLLVAAVDPTRTYGTVLFGQR